MTCLFPLSHSLYLHLLTKLLVFRHGRAAAYSVYAQRQSNDQTWTGYSGALPCIAESTPQHSYTSVLEQQVLESEETCVSFTSLFGIHDPTHNFAGVGNWHGKD